jgi:ketosteroid isomerase-like protein
MPDSENVAVARRIYDAYAKSDRAAAERLIADDFRFTSPLDNGLDRKTYFETCWPNSERIEGFDLINAVADGDQVFVTYEARSTSGGRFRNSEILRVRSGKIAEVEVYFGWSLPHEAKAGTHINQTEAAG